MNSLIFVFILGATLLVAGLFIAKNPTLKYKKSTAKNVPFAFKFPKDYSANQKKFSLFVSLMVLVFLGLAVYSWIILNDKFIARSLISLGLIFWGIQIFIIGKFIK